MAIFIYCEDCDATVEPNSCKHNKEFDSGSRNMGVTINMRSNPWAKQTQVEFSQTTMEQDIKDRNNR